MTKIDQIAGNKEEKICVFQTMLKTALEAKLIAAMQSIEKQHDAFEQQLVELRKSVLESGRQVEEYRSSLIKTEEMLKRKIKPWFSSGAMFTFQVDVSEVTMYAVKSYGQSLRPKLME